MKSERSEFVEYPPELGIGTYCKQLKLQGVSFRIPHIVETGGKFGIVLQGEKSITAGHRIMCECLAGKYLNPVKRPRESLAKHLPRTYVV